MARPYKESWVNVALKGGCYKAVATTAGPVSQHSMKQLPKVAPPTRVQSTRIQSMQVYVLGIVIALSARDLILVCLDPSGYR